MNINIKTFAKYFSEEYNRIYNNHDNVEHYEENIARFDDYIKENNEFVKKFAEFRGDFISSDREASAFIFALDRCS